MSEYPIVHDNFIIQKTEVKGAWSYVLLPPVHHKTGLPFGWFVVKGSIDDYQISQFKLWPTADNKLFLPLKSEIRKKIKKDVGDSVEIILFKDESAVVIPDEFIMCLEDSPQAKYHFDKMSPTSQKQYVDYVYATKSLDARARRMTKTIEKLEQGQKYHERD